MMMLSWAGGYTILSRQQTRVYERLRLEHETNAQRWFTASELYGRPDYKASLELRSLNKLVFKGVAESRQRDGATIIEFRFLAEQRRGQGYGSNHVGP